VGLKGVVGVEDGEGFGVDLFAGCEDGRVDEFVVMSCGFRGPVVAGVFGFLLVGTIAVAVIDALAWQQI